MSSFRQKTKTVTVSAIADEAPGIVRVWDDPTSSPLKNLTIIITGAFDATKVTYQMFLGGVFINSDSDSVPPYSSDAVSITGGVPHGGADEVGSSDVYAAKIISFGDYLFPMNNPSRSTNLRLPFFIELQNSNLVDITVNVTFISEPMETTV